MKITALARPNGTDRSNQARTTLAGLTLSNQTNACAIGECLDTQHPTLAGRIAIRWALNPGDEPQKAWLPCLRHVVPRVGDRVMLAQPGNFEEWVVAGVLDGFARRPKPRRADAVNVELAADERVIVRSSDGLELLAVQTEHGSAVVELLSADTRIRLPGRLDLEAEAIALRATHGGIDLRAHDDVDVRGETIHLNPVDDLDQHNAQRGW